MCRVLERQIFDFRIIRQKTIYRVWYKVCRRRKLDLSCWKFLASATFVTYCCCLTIEQMYYLKKQNSKIKFLKIVGYKHSAHKNIQFWFLKLTLEMRFIVDFNLAKIKMFEDTKVANFHHNRSKFPLTFKLRPEGKIPWIVTYNLIIFDYTNSIDSILVIFLK